MTQVVIDPAALAAIQAVKADVGALSNSVAAISKGIKSVQRGVTNVNNTTVNVTISSVNPSKTFVHLLSYSVQPGGNGSTGDGYVKLTSSTNLVVMSTTFSNMSWEVVEYY